MRRRWTSERPSRSTGPAAGHSGVPSAVHDQYAAAIGAGVVSAGDINCGTGTAWVLLANTDRLAPPISDKAFVCCHPIANLYGQMLSLGNGGSAIEWVMRLLGHERSSLAHVDRLAEASPPGSAGLRFWPLLMPTISGRPAVPAWWTVRCDHPS